nr:HNH endonuclease [Amycolatopsis sp. SID8362]
MLVHRAVLAAFIGPCPSGWHGCHRNQVKTDNRLENLRWDSPKGNAADTIHSGRHVSVVMRNRAEARRAVRSA